MKITKKAFFFSLVCAFVMAAALVALPSEASAAHNEDQVVFRTACVTYGNVVPVGKQLTFAAGHFGGEGEVTYRWFGAVEGEGEFMRPTFMTPGPKLITVMATDEEGRTATAGCPVIAKTGITAARYENLQGGIGGAPVYPAPGAGLEQPEVTPQAPPLPGTETPDITEDEDEETTPATTDSEDETEEEDGVNIGRIILWILIALIIISLAVLFWQRYREDGTGSGNAGTPKKEEKAKTEGRREETKEQPPTSAYREVEEHKGGDETIIIPPTR